MLLNDLLYLFILLSFIAFFLCMHICICGFDDYSSLTMKESSIEKKDHELQSKEIFEKEIASLKDKIDSIQVSFLLSYYSCSFFFLYNH